MLKFALVLLVVFDLSYGALPRGYCPPGIVGNWPMPNRLLGFWPFDVNSNLDDLANEQCLDGHRPKVMTEIYGPFGESLSSFSVAQDNSFIGYKQKLGIPSQFTISFYIYTYPRAANPTGGILMFWPDLLVEPRFGISYRRLDNTRTYLDLWSGPKRWTPLAEDLAILTTREWTFVALTYDSFAKSLNIYNGEGESVAAIENVNIPTDLTSRLNVGYSYAGPGKLPFMMKSDAIACLMFYNITLTPEQIKILPEVCRTKGQGQISTLPTSEIPTKTTPDIPTTTAPPKPPTPSTITPKKPTTTTPDDDDETTVEEPDEPTTSTKKPFIPSWPRQDALLGFWPLDSQYELEDLSPNKWENTATGSPVITKGPYGDGETAVSPSMDDETILEVRDSKFSVSTTSFTVSFFFKRGADSGKTGGIFEFLPGNAANTKAVQIRYMSPTMIEVGANDVSPFQIDMIQPDGAWTFLALVYDKTGASTVTLYGRNGVLALPASKPQFKSGVAYCNNGIRLGMTTRWNKQGLTTGDAVSCLMVYNAALTPDEIRQAYRSCRITHETAPCGAPKLPLPAIPTTTSGAVIPQAGQFPYVAAIRSTGDVECSATIIDAFWLITSRKCFVDPDLTTYTVYVGAHDLAVPESHRREHAITRAVPSGSADRDIVLVQLTTPIDFTNEYVTDACTIRDEKKTELQLADTQFVYGWGANGRPSTGSQTVARYASGKMLTDAGCLAQWPASYTAGSDLCYLTTKNNLDVPCAGDEGSPLLAKLPRNPTLGTDDRLVATGVYYGRDDACAKAGLFADLTKWSSWIAEKIACVVPGLPATYTKACPQR